MQPSLRPTVSIDEGPQQSTIIIISLTTVLSLIVAFVVALICYRRRRAAKERNASSSFDPSSHKFPIVLVEDSNADIVQNPKVVKKENSEEQYDAFLTHNWGHDVQGRDNHKRVIVFKKLLEDKFDMKPLWLDEEKMTGDIHQQMCDGIDQSSLIIVFVTQAYIDKVAGRGLRGDKDNCRLEFNYAARKKGANKLIAVVMEDACSDPDQWDGPVGMHLGGQLYFSCTKDSDMEQCVELVFEDMAKRRRNKSGDDDSIVQHDSNFSLLLSSLPQENANTP